MALGKTDGPSQKPVNQTGGQTKPQQLPTGGASQPLGANGRTDQLGLTTRPVIGGNVVSTSEGGIHSPEMRQAAEEGITTKTSSELEVVQP